MKSAATTAQLEPYHNGKLRGWRISKYSEAALASVLTEDKADIIFKNSAHCRVGVYSDTNNLTVLKKIQYKRSWRTRLKRSLQTPRSKRCLKASQAWLELGVNTPEVYAAITEYSYIFCPGDDILIGALWPTGSLSLSQLTEENELPADWISQVCEIMHKLHSNGWEHGDLSLRNWYWVPDDGSIGLIDLDSAVRWPGGNLPKGRRLRELSRVISSLLRLKKLALSSTEGQMLYDKFVQTYWQISQINPGGRKLWDRTKYLTLRQRKNG